MNFCITSSSKNCKNVLFTCFLIKVLGLQILRKFLEPQTVICIFEWARHRLLFFLRIATQIHILWPPPAVFKFMDYPGSLLIFFNASSRFANSSTVNPSNCSSSLLPSWSSSRQKSSSASMAQKLWKSDKNWWFPTLKTHASLEGSVADFVAHVW